MKHIKELDGLRGLLALWVFASHAIELGPYARLAPTIRPNLAVDIFIILSGFVIFHLLSTGEDYRTFITRRWFRLFPVFAVCFLAALVLYSVLRINDETAFGIGPVKSLTPYLVTHATMLHGAVPEQLLPRTARAFLVPAWSVSVEWQFYLVAPLLFAFAMRPTKKLFALLAVLLGMRVALEILAHTSYAQALTFDLYAFLPLRLEFFAVGIGSYGIWQWFTNRPAPPRLPPLSYALLVPVVILAAKKNPAIGLWLCLFFALIQIRFYQNSILARVVSRPLNSSFVQFLGKISYCVYLLHLPALVLVRHVMQPQAIRISGPAFQGALLCGGVVATIGGAWLLHTTTEQPFIQLGKRITAGWKIRYAQPPSLGTAPAG